MKNNHLPRILKCLKIVPGTLSDYHQLSIFHYCGDSPGPVRYVYTIIEDHILRRLSGPLVGVIVYGTGAANLAIRNKATNNLFGELDRASGLGLLNQNLLCIRRVIIDPRYRGLGLATKLVKETLPMTGSPLVEALSVMGRVQPFFARAGMNAYTQQLDSKTERLQSALETIGIDRTCWHDGRGVHETIQALPPAKRQWIESELDRFAQKFTSLRNCSDSCQRTEELISRLTAKPIYYLWRSPDKEVKLTAG